MDKVLIIGASGYIGARLSYLLADEGYNVTAVCFPKTPEDKIWLSKMSKVILGDITSSDFIDKITDNEYHTAIHLVSLDHKDSNKKPDYVNSINVMPVWNILEAFKQKKTLRKFLYFSTIHVYGEISSGVIEESYLPAPLNPYGLTHLMAENICNMFNNTSKMECINIRMANSYGSPYFKDNNCWWLVINDLCRQAFLEKKIVLRSDGSAWRDFIHYRDVFIAIQKLLTNNVIGKANTFHFSSGKTYSILQIAEKIRSVYKSKYKIEIPIITPEATNVNISALKNGYVIDNRRIRSLGFELSTDVESGINELFNYFENNEI